MTELGIAHKQQAAVRACEQAFPAVSMHLVMRLGSAIVSAPLPPPPLRGSRGLRHPIPQAVEDALAGWEDLSRRTAALALFQPGQADPIAAQLPLEPALGGVVDKVDGASSAQRTDGAGSSCAAE